MAVHQPHARKSNTGLTESLTTSTYSPQLHTFLKVYFEVIYLPYEWMWELALVDDDVQ
jgi:hypothetical protein|eukprot:m.212500 g.212500  ORF g.212500 m.212500 type:complete len:58 (-) comp25532_c1_seq2:170-343(-)